MSDEGVRLVSKLALVVVLILAGALLRTVVGPSKRRGRVMAFGTVSGMALGILTAPSISNWFGADVSVITSCVGMMLGWGVSWQFAKQLPRAAQ